MKKILSSIAIIVIALYGNNAIAKTCPAGFFCTANGQYTISSQASTYYGWTEIPSYMYGSAELVVPGWGMWSDEGLCSNKKSDGTPYSGCIYTATDYDEVWVSLWFGFYTVKNGEVLYKSSGGSTAPGAFPCPGTYPSSETGASSVFQCYRTTNNAQKEYYKAPNNTSTSNNTQNNYNGNYNTDEINALLTNLQSALAQANTAANNLQNTLKKSNNNINVQAINRNKINTDITTIQNAATTQTAITATINDTKSTNSQTTNQNTTGTTESTSDNTQSSTNKKFDFGDLSYTFTNAKVAKNIPTRSAIQQKKSATTRSAKTLTPTTKRIRENTQQTRPAQTKTRKSTPNPRQQGNI